MEVNVQNINIVLLSEFFNPSVFSQLMLIKTGLLSEDEELTSPLFTPDFTLVKTRNVELLVVRDRLQLSLLPDYANPESYLCDRIKKISESLPYVQYKVIGFNFDYQITSTKVDDMGKFSRRIFLSEANPLRLFFETSDSRIGVHLSKNVFEMLLQVDIKPVRLSNDKDEALIMKCNFNKSLKEDDAVNTINMTLTRWQEAQTLSRELVDKIAENL